MTAGERRRGLEQTFASKLTTLFETVFRTPTGDLWTNTLLSQTVTGLGVPTVQSYISQLRAGKRTNPSAKLVGAIATAFGVPVGYFYSDQDVDPEEMRTVAALRNAGVQSVAWRASQLSAAGLEKLEQMADYIAELEGVQIDKHA